MSKNTLTLAFKGMNGVFSKRNRPNIKEKLISISIGESNPLEMLNPLNDKINLKNDQKAIKNDLKISLEKYKKEKKHV